MKIILWMFLVIIVASCEKNPDTHFTYDIFECHELPDGGVEIIGLTEEGLKLEEVVFPSKIEGYTYVGVGGYQFQRDTTRGIRSENMKTVILSDNIVVYKLAFYHSPNLEKIIINSLDIIPFGKNAFNWYPESNTKVYVPFEVYNEYYNSPEWDTYKHKLESTSVSFYYNYDDASNQGLYTTSITELGEKIEEPTNPTREGYTFEGWFIESECINEWDFESDLEIQMPLYAKWVKK